MYFINYIKLYKTQEIKYNSIYGIIRIHIVGDIVHMSRLIRSNGKSRTEYTSIHRKYIQDIQLEKLWWCCQFENKSVAIEEEQIKLKQYKEDE